MPGVIVTQHSGEGKANQYFLRGFNLDHGTDFAVTVAGVPVNMPTHGHGQGYADPNFLIPELVSGVQYKKGPYFADDGDFSAAGAVERQLPGPARAAAGRARRAAQWATGAGSFAASPRSATAICSAPRSRAQRRPVGSRPTTSAS